MKFSNNEGHIDDKVLSAEEERRIIEQSPLWKAHLEEHQMEHTRAELVVFEEDPIKKQAIPESVEGVAYFKQAPAMGCACGKVSFKIDEKNSVHEYSIADEEKPREYSEKAYGKAEGGAYKR